MKNKLISFILAMILILSVSVPAMAVDYGVIYDETELLNGDMLTNLGEEVLPNLTEQYGLDLRVDVLTSTDFDTPYDTAEHIYDKYEYGCGDDETGLTLTIILDTDDDLNPYLADANNWAIYARGGDDGFWTDGGLVDMVTYAVAPYMDTQAWSGDSTQLTASLVQAVNAMVTSIVDYYTNGTNTDLIEPSTAPEIDTAPSPDEESTEMNYIVDTADLLSYDEWSELEQRAEAISNEQGCGVYVVTVDDYMEYGTGDTYDVTTQIYHNEDNPFGVGSGRDGIMLLLSMEDRDWAMFVYGDKAEYAFNAYGQEELEKVFLDNFGGNDWQGGFTDYLDSCEEYLTKANTGNPIRKSPMLYIVCSIGASLLVAFVVCSILKSRMNTVHKKVDADTYTTGDINLTESFDRYTHTTTVRRKIEKSSSGSSSHSGGGGSGRSGKF